MHKRKRIYLYPMRDYVGLKEKHPYVYNLAEALSENFLIINLGKPRYTGNRDFGKFFLKTDIVYLNWIEDSPFRESIFFLFFFFFFKLFKKKVVWTHHNVRSHKKNTKINLFLTKLLTKYADYVVLHTKESFPILKMDEKDKRALYFFHPFFHQEVLKFETEKQKKYDLLIWGNVRRSKGVDAFLAYLKTSNNLGRYKIKIVGKFESKEYYEEILNNYNVKNIEISNEFVKADQLNYLHQISEFVFFPYTGPSVLNSGALVTSMPKGTKIIGPTTGAFKEMGEAGLIYNYDTFQDVLKILDSKHQTFYNEDKISEFILEHSWKRFSDFISNSVK